LVLACFFILPNAQYCGPWVPIDWTQVPVAHPNDTIDVYYMAAPLLYCSHLDEFTYVNGYHGGIGTINRNTGARTTYNYVGFPAFSGTFLPTIIKNSNGSYTLDWHNFGKTFIYAGINETYWHSLQQKIAVMNGAQFNQFRLWLSHANQTYRYYDPWFVYEYFPSKPLLSGFECFQWAIQGVLEIKALGAQMLPGYDKLMVSVGSAYSWSQPKKVDFYDPAWRDRITEFYLLVDEKFSALGLLGLIVELWEFLVDGDFFVRYNNDYYFVELAFPYFEMHWTALPIQTFSGVNKRLPIVHK